MNEAVCLVKMNIYITEPETLVLTLRLQYIDVRSAGGFSKLLEQKPEISNGNYHGEGQNCRSSTVDGQCDG